jgi:MFS family permease
VRARITAVLFLAQSFFSASSIAAFTLSPIIAAQLSGSDGAAGIPNALSLAGRAAFAFPFGILMDRLGRRLALTTGYSMAIFGGVVSVWAIVNNSYLGFLLGALLLGASRAAGDQSRYVGAEIFPQAQRAKVIGLIVSAGTIGAVLGPQLAPLSERLLAGQNLPTTANLFVVATVLMVPATLTIFLLLRPDPREMGRAVAQAEAEAHPESVENWAAKQRPLRHIFAAPMVQLAILSMVLSFFVMAFLMVITPLHMDHHNHSTLAISNVIMAHTLGMFGLAWLTGGLIDRFGRITMIVVGALVLILSCVLAPLSLRVPILALALFMLGLGWNFCYVAGSSLLSDALAAHERGRAQGASEALVALTAGLASLSVGSVFQQGDYLLVSAIGFAFTLLLVVATVWLVRKDRRASPTLTAHADLL